jgi:hypothetical protein
MARTNSFVCLTLFRKIVALTFVFDIKQVGLLYFTDMGKRLSLPENICVEL